MERLQKVLARAGIASRRSSEKLIQEGHVKVNGNVVVELGLKVSPNDIITVDDVEIVKEELVYYVLNKPSGYLSTVSDEKGRKTVLDLFKKEDLDKRIYPVGRIDYDTAGVLLLTNDGEFFNALMNPKNEIEKEYLARVEGIVTKEEIRFLTKGVKLKTGYVTKPCKATIVCYDKKNNSTLLNIIITEGKYHQIKQMTEAISHKVKKLTRIRVSIITLDNLPRGSYRKLKIHEVKQLYNGGLKWK